MVVKTDLCAFSEFRIYPGHGVKFIRRDGQPVNLINSKCRHLSNQRKKPAKLMWTQSWRRLHKKGKEEGGSKKRSRRVVKAQRAIVGASLEELKKKRQATKPQSVATESALKEVKSRQKTVGTAKLYSTGPRNTAKAAIPKVQRSAANARGGSKR
mmetsp:Transcript_1538/g.1546  ORF Transcript_1538/g.1546 Transcript_1538/m.1546 type:complete len:155 (-) Transcript_1538:126-590(-)|eukprot:CAMPEP_0174817656 /NCGR_PEP_ID=MMETSP1107-20130205/89_1 /TAXON_ID=36770 /ORGANISM="Paraphysomonas vestita, Strain GFlagA" /LENGTH=154 /DNA_ID=CAMNT_0016028567 /DNA_START=51 /DNA_END=515 /DNA_ORIENTATION=-